MRVKKNHSFLQRIDQYINKQFLQCMFEVNIIEKKIVKINEFITYTCTSANNWSLNFLSNKIMINKSL